MRPDLTSIDLFCGCGGFSLGMKQVGFHTLAAIDSDPKAIAVFKANSPSVPHVLCRDLTKFSAEDLSSLAGITRVDVIVGGPPCQGFSQVRQRDGANHGPRLVPDPRRALYRDFLTYVSFFKPKVFVMENVLGIRTTESGHYFTGVQSEARELGYRVHGQILRACEFGVPQTRQRQIIIGTLKHLPYFRPNLVKPTHRESRVTLGEAIGDLPVLKAGEGIDPAEYDLVRRHRHVAKYGTRYLYHVIQVHKSRNLTAHCARPHSERDLRDFSRLREGEHAHEAMERGESFEFPYDKAVFRDRYTRQHRKRLCSTIVAHLGKDGLMFIHPTQNRSLTPREAARVQSFPDWFAFPVARTHQFRLIGNAVPPLVGKAVGKAVAKYLSQACRRDNEQSEVSANCMIPSSEGEAVEAVMRLVHAADEGRLPQVPSRDFKCGWFAVAFLFPGLHPDSLADLGSEVVHEVPRHDDDNRVPGCLITPYYAQSGWPVALESVLAEAWKRYEANDLAEEDLYCVEAQKAGIEFFAGTRLFAAR